MCLNWQFYLKALFIFTDPHGTGWHIEIFAGSRFDCADYSLQIGLFTTLKLK